MKKKSTAIALGGNKISLKNILEIANGAPLLLDSAAKKNVDKSRKLVKSVVKKQIPSYGINTGFGYLANKTIDEQKLEQLQANLIKSHASGYGPSLSIQETRLAMALRAHVLAKGYTGVRYELCEALLDLIKAEIYPLIPESGSVGASGDLIPLAHLALPLLGLGMVNYKGNILSAAEALGRAGLKPITLIEKEGLSLINGTQIMLAVGGLALARAKEILELADLIAALSYEGLGANPEALDPQIHKVRNQKGQIFCAEQILESIQGSYLFSENRKRLRLQDPYSIRCVPQIHGASRDAIDYASLITERELNGITDNPLVFAEEKKIVSGGNFHGQPLAMALDFAGIALSEMANVSDRRLEVLMNPHMSGLPAFLTPNEGLNSGFMTFQYLSASLVNENKLLANPASTDSIPGNVGIEDHVSMGMHSAKKLKKIVENLQVLLTLEMIAAAQAIDMRRAFPLGKETKKVYDTIRKEIPVLKEDRILQEDIEKGLKVFHSLKR